MTGHPVGAVQARGWRNFFSVVSTIGTPIDITAQELRVEAFFPTDDATRRNWAASGARLAHHDVRT